MQRPFPARINLRSGFFPSSSITAWVASTIISILKVFGERLWTFSRASNNFTNASICSGMVTLGSMTTKLSGILFPECSSKVVMKMSSVRMPLDFKSSVNGLILIPMKGEIVFSFIPFANSIAAFTAVSSSSLSGLFPNPSSKSIRKSSTPSYSNLEITFL